jgi:hypothetical protein
MTDPGAHTRPCFFAERMLAPFTRSAKTTWVKPKAKRWFFVATSIAFLAVVAGYLSRPQLPQHDGKTLDEWLQQINDAGSHAKLGPVYEAFEAMGTNAIPHLYKYMVTLDPPWKKKIASIWSRQSLIPVPFTLAEEKSGPAFLAFIHLRSQAAPLIPQVNQLRDTMPYGWSRLRSLIPANLEDDFIAACESTNASVRSSAASGLSRASQGVSYSPTWGPGTFKTNIIFHFAFTFGPDDMDLLVKNLSHTNVYVRRATAEALGDSAIARSSILHFKKRSTMKPK